MTKEQQAAAIYDSIYLHLFEFGQGLAEEILISFLAKSLALKTVSQILRSSPSRIDPKNGLKIDNSLFWVGVQNEIEKM